MSGGLNRAPVAIFAFNRVDHLRGTFECLTQCHGFAESPITIFIDGPRHAGDEADVQAVRDYVKSLPFENVSSVIREKNMGLRKSIFEGVTALTETYGRAIVLEDDFLLSPVILDYFNDALAKYADDTRVWNVVGYMYDVPEFEKRDTALVLPYTHPWGWATWHRAWRQFTLDEPVQEDNIRSRSFRFRFNLSGVANYVAMLQMAMTGKVNSWYVQWYYRMTLSGGLSIFPPRSYVVNRGIGDVRATHGSKLNPYRFLTRPTTFSTEPISLPDKLEINFADVDAIANCRDARAQRLVIALGRIKRLFK